MTSSTRILGLVTGAFGGRGGIAAVTRDLAMALSIDDRVTSVLLLPRDAEVPHQSLPERIEQRRPIAGWLTYSLAALWAGLRFRPTIVLCNHVYMAPLAAIAARLTGAKLLIHVHGIEIWREPTWLRRRALAAADLLVCVSRDTRARTLAWTDLAPERAVVLNNTVGDVFTPGARHSARKRLELSEEAVLLTVGRLDASERYKGHDLVIASLPALAKAFPDITYLIAGDGNDRPRVETLCAGNGTAARVRFLGHVPASDLPDLYRAADLFVMPSSGEGFGVAFLEAMACGTRAVGLGIGGATDALADGALGVIANEENLGEVLARELAALPPEGNDLAHRVDTRFGRAAYQARVEDLLGMLLTPDIAAASARQIAHGTAP